MSGKRSKCATASEGVSSERSRSVCVERVALQSTPLFPKRTQSNPRVRMTPPITVGLGRSNMKARPASFDAWAKMVARISFIESFRIAESRSQLFKCAPEAPSP